MRSKKTRLLVVEDDSAFRQAISDLFSLFNFDVTAAADGQEAWDLLQKEEFKAVISDMQMPKMGGYDLLKKVRERNSASPTFLIISGFHDHTIADLYAEGADGFFAKPFDASEVRKFVNGALASANEKWSSEYSNPNAVPLNRHFPEFNKAIDQKEILFGRQGFFLPMEHDAPAPGTVVQFHFYFGRLPQQLEMSGFGKVLFFTEQGSKSGVGIEILHLNPDAKTEVLELIAEKKFVSAIPRL